MEDLHITGYYNSQPIIRSVSAVNLIDTSVVRNQSNTSLVSTLNTVPGLRMEERSPGSYRLSMRGSLLRSPFGIRNVKIYFDNFPLTDAGGNTYLNLLDAKVIGNLEIYKGPEASIFGANTGGSMLLKPIEIPSMIQASVTAGSFGLFQQTAGIQHRYKNYRFTINQGYQRSDGYRENSGMNRKYFLTNHQWGYNTSSLLNFFLFYSDLRYQTPGGLTAIQMEQNPQQARPATASLPGATAQQAAIYNKTLFAGLSNSYQISKQFKHVLALFGSYTDFKNPFITNYEKRYENTLGFRTFLEFSNNHDFYNFKIQGGLESSRTQTIVKNFDNEGGVATTLQANDDLNANQNFAFFLLNFDIQKTLLAELSSSINFFRYTYQSFYPVAISEQKRTFDVHLMPKFALSYLLNPSFSVRASVSQGYATPTLAEIRSSNNTINTDLEAEKGWNYEIGVRFKTENNRLYLAANLFNFQLRDAIVRRLDANDTEYFINAGGTNQNGFEAELSWAILNKNHAFLNKIQLKNSYTYSNYSFKNYKNANIDYSGNKLTGVPENVLVSSLEFNFKQNFYFFAQHNYTSSIPLNDANSVYARKYHLIELKTGIRGFKIGGSKLELYAGINNLLNESYSLGNDLNAANSRYFNPAATRNFYTGLSLNL
ncbi:TonB-dependent receptor [Pedobacter sp. MW01-1-1]|uniref:TonB-dependent receptor n=1 Tax=Pedobacter sp. MW01-1-1 TaxID=3383027 RepID=UPI003FED7A1A